MPLLVPYSLPEVAAAGINKRQFVCVVLATSAAVTDSVLHGLGLHSVRMA